MHHIAVYLVELPDGSVCHIHARPWVMGVKLVGIVKENDIDFVNVQYAATATVIDCLPSIRIDPDRCSHSTVDQQTELLALLD